MYFLFKYTQGVTNPRCRCFPLAQHEDPFSKSLAALTATRMGTYGGEWDICY
jgi:hypothetical protein